MATKLKVFDGPETAPGNTEQIGLVWEILLLRENRVSKNMLVGPGRPDPNVLLNCSGLGDPQAWPYNFRTLLHVTVPEGFLEHGKFARPSAKGVLEYVKLLSSLFPSPLSPSPADPGRGRAVVPALPDPHLTLTRPSVVPASMITRPPGAVLGVS